MSISKIRLDLKRYVISMMQIDGRLHLQLQSLAKELYIWSKLNHPNILGLEGFYVEDGRHPALVSKWIENGSVIDYLKKHPDIPCLSIVSFHDIVCVIYCPLMCFCDRSRGSLKALYTCTVKISSTQT